MVESACASHKCATVYNNASSLDKIPGVPRFQAHCFFPSHPTCRDQCVCNSTLYPCIVYVVGEGGGGGGIGLSLTAFADKLVGEVATLMYMHVLKPYLLLSLNLALSLPSHPDKVSYAMCSWFTCTTYC